MGALGIDGWTWLATIGVIVGLLALDLEMAAFRPHKVRFGEATAWSVFYILAAVAFGVWFTLAHGGQFGAEFFIGYIVEKSLSVDNLFVFVIIMTTFVVPEEQQHNVLTFGIVLALIMRGIFIGLGAALAADHGPVRWRQAVHARRRPAHGDAVVLRARGDRQRRPALRARLDPGDLRRQAHLALGAGSVTAHPADEPPEQTT